MSVIAPYQKPNSEESTRWVRVKNTSGEDAPSYALLRVTGTDGDGTYLVGKPNENGQDGLLVASRFGVMANSYGMATTESPATIAYARSSGNDPQPTIGSIWGSKANSWYAWEEQRGFLIIGNRIDTDVPNGVVDAIRTSAIGVDEVWLARLTSALGNKYSWQERIYNQSGSETDGPRSGTHNARPVMYDSWNSSTPGLPVGTSSTGTLVLMWETQQTANKYYFLPLVYASNVRGGYLSIDDQTIKGIKRFLDRTHSDVGFTAGSYTTPTAKYYPFYSKITDGSYTATYNANLVSITGPLSTFSSGIKLPGDNGRILIERESLSPPNKNTYTLEIHSNSINETYGVHNGGALSVNVGGPVSIVGTSSDNDQFAVATSFYYLKQNTWDNNVYAINTVYIHCPTDNAASGGGVMYFWTDYNDSKTVGHALGRSVTHIGSAGQNTLFSAAATNPSATIHTSLTHNGYSNYVSIRNEGQISISNRVKMGTPTVRQIDYTFGIGAGPAKDIGAEGNGKIIMEVNDQGNNGILMTLNSKGKLFVKSIDVSGDYYGTIDGGAF